MTQSSDANWDELGVVWRAVNPNVTVIASRLEARLSRQSQWMTAVLVIGLPLCGAGLLLGAATIGIGCFSGAWNFVTRGIAIIAMSAVLGYAVLSLQPLRSPDTTRAISELIDLAVDRAQRTLSLIRASLYACVIAAVFGLIGTAIRTHLGRPPKMSPIIDLVILALIALALFLYRRQVQFEQEKYRTLKLALAADGDA
jgi:hypothetical protein